MVMKIQVSKTTRFLVGLILIGLLTAFSTLTNISKENSRKNLQASDEKGVKSTSTQKVSVIKVIDGDTIKVSYQNKEGKLQEKTVRLIGIDSPETVHPNKPVQCFGKEASKKLNDLLNAHDVILVNDVSQGDYDKYGRLLRYVFTENNTNINLYMITEGYAYEYTYDQPYKYSREFKDAQKTAEKEKKGLWADGVCSN